MPGSSVDVLFLVKQTDDLPTEPFGIAFSAAPEPPAQVVLLMVVLPIVLTDFPEPPVADSGRHPDTVAVTVSTLLTVTGAPDASFEQLTCVAAEPGADNGTTMVAPAASATAIKRVGTESRMHYPPDSAPSRHVPEG